METDLNYTEEFKGLLKENVGDKTFTKEQALVYLGKRAEDMFNYFVDAKVILKNKSKELYKFAKE